MDIEQLLPTINNFTKEEKKSLNDYDISIVFMGIELTGGTESPNPLFQYFFGELDKDNTIKQDTPSYYFSPKDEENNLGTLL
ncbi:lysozyme, partial [Helicobacter japonicus]